MTMITQEQALEKFQAIIGEKTVWQYLLKSQFLEHLSVFQSWALRQGLFAVERAVQEFFLSTALNESSIRAHAEDREYVLRKPIPSRGIVEIKNGSQTHSISIPKGTSFESNNRVGYMTDDALVLAAGETLSVSASQVSKLQIFHTITESKVFYEILIDRTYSQKLYGMRVYVDLGEGAGFQEWAYSRMFRNTLPADQVWDEFYSHEDQTGVRFGNGVFGVVPPVSAEVRLDLLLSDGDTFLGEGQRLSLVDNLIDEGGTPANISCTVVDAIANGFPRESGEELRTNLHYWPLYNDEIIWRDDYIFYLRKLFPGITWIKVWGEEEAEEKAGAPSLDFINKIFISAYQPDGTFPDFEWGLNAINRGDWVAGETYALKDVVTVSSGVKLVCVTAHTASAPEPTSVHEKWELYAPYQLAYDSIAAMRQLHLYNRDYEWVYPIFSTFTVEVTGKISRELSIDDVEQDIKDQLSGAYGLDSTAKLNEVFLKDLYRLISATGHFAPSDSYFTVVPSGTFEVTQLEEVVAIDLPNSTFNVTYL